MNNISAANCLTIDTGWFDMLFMYIIIKGEHEINKIKLKHIAVLTLSLF